MSAPFKSEPPTNEPYRCPHCESYEVRVIGPWLGVSHIEENNEADLTEWVCRDDACGRSFWV